MIFPMPVLKLNAELCLTASEGKPIFPVGVSCSTKRKHEVDSLYDDAKFLLRTFYRSTPRGFQNIITNT
jgi:hypothetical protein